MIHRVMQKPSPVIVLLYIFEEICKRRHFCLSLQQFENSARTWGLETRHTLNAIFIGLSCSPHAMTIESIRPLTRTRALGYNLALGVNG